ncbi:MAG: co-chaperone GroES [Propionibacteriales bacterium]|nr:co-chaperone GroES [Propionibacteriales bacterium]
MTPLSRSLDDKLPIRMLHDRVLVSLDSEVGERRSSAGIVIPATAQMGRRLAWARVAGVGSNVRTVEVGDRVLFDPEDKAEIEVRGEEFVLLRERDLHAVASERLEDGQTGLYL